MSLQSILSNLFRRTPKVAVATKPAGLGRAGKGMIAGSVALTALATGVIADFEGRSLRAYQDIVKVWTICDGETKGVKRGDVATDAECDTMLAKNIVLYETYLDRCLTAPVPGKMKVALVSWTLNVGGGAVCKGGPGGGPATVVNRANAGNLVGACDALLAWNKAGGREVRGLTNRRQAERTLCLQGVKEGM